MKVNTTSTAPLLNGTASSSSTRGDTGTRAGRSNTGAGAGSDVALSTAGRQLAALQDSHSDVRAERIEQIRNALAAGELTIDPARIADGLLDSMRELLKDA